MKKRCLYVSFLLVLLFALVGCGKDDSELLGKAIMNAHSAKSLDGQMKMDIVMSVKNNTGASMDMNCGIDCKVLWVKAPEKTKMVMTLSALGQKQTETEYSIVQNDEERVYKSKDDIHWDTETKPLSKKNEMNLTDLLNEKDNFIRQEDKKDNGTRYAVYKGDISKSMLKRALSSTNTSEQTKSNLNVDDDTLDQIYETVKNPGFTIWVNEDTQQIYRVQLSVGEYLKEAMKVNHKNSINDGAFEIEISKADVTLTVNAYNSFDSIDIPQEVIDAAQDVRSKVNIIEPVSEPAINDGGSSTGPIDNPDIETPEKDITDTDGADLESKDSGDTLFTE